MTPSGRRLLIIAVAVATTFAWYLWWSSAAVQADRTFRGLENAIEQGRAGAVVDALHHDYDIRAAWPNQLGGDAGGMVGDGMLRLLVIRGLAGLFQLQSADPFVFAYTIHDVAPQDDGTVVVTASIDLSTTSGERPLTFTPRLNAQRFVLARDGWWPTLYVRSHPAFSVAY
jgi:hypothetical protein